MSSKFIILDGNALVHRAFHALPPLTAKNGQVVNAVYGFASIVFKMLAELKPEYAAATFDLAAPTFRHREYKEYKAKRIKQPQELYDQFPLVKDLLRAMGIPIYEKEGFEADDVIATIVTKSQADNLIVTGDMDTLQLVNDNTKVYGLKKGVSETVIYDEKAVEERYGLKPTQMVDYKALRGDPSDNILGVKGIGEKTAATLIQKTGSIEKLYQLLEKEKDIKILNIKYLISASIKEKIIKGKKDAIFSKHLVELVKDVPIQFNLEDCRLGDYANEKVKELLRDWEFGSLLKRLEKREGVAEKKIENKRLKIIEVKNEKDAKELKKALNSASRVAIYLSTGDQNGFKTKLFGLAITSDGLKIFYIPVDLAENIKYSILNIKIIGHDLKRDCHILKRQGLELSGQFRDVMLMDYLLNPGTRAHGLNALALRYLSKDLGEGEQASLFGSDLKQMAERTACLWQLGEKLEEDLKEKGFLNLYEKIEAPLILVLARMEEAGIKIDVPRLGKLSVMLKKKEQRTKNKIFELAGGEFNVASPQQLKEILFDKLKISIKGIRRGKTGLSTAASELEKMRGQHPIIDLIFEYREIAKLQNTYVDVLPGLVEPKTNRLHTTFNQAVTATGRLSSSEPNLQNIPARGKLGQAMRECFIAEKGHQLLSADYSQIELRVVASLANDKEMMEIFQRGEDIHTMTAAKINGVLPAAVTSEMRHAAKAINFGIIYGMGPQSLAESTSLSFAEAKEFIRKYFEIFKEVKNFLDETRALAHSLGYVETLFGRRRYLPEINSQMFQVRNAAERMAVNHPVQGAAADLIKMAMIEVDKRIMNSGIKMLLQVHDELVFEVKEDEAKKWGKEIQIIMENVVKLKVPVKVDVKVGGNWGEM